MNITLIWVIALIVFILIEAVTYQLVTIWFAVGALGAAVCAMANGSLYLQIGVFFVLSVALLCIIRPISMRHFKNKGEKTNVDSLIGMDVLITERVDNIRASGKGKLCGMEWSVRSADGNELSEGDVAVVEKIEGVKLIVKKKI